VVELAAAVVRDIDPIDAVLDRDLGILGGGDALERKRNLELVLEPFDGSPIERRLKVAARRTSPAGRDVALGNIALAPAVDRGVDGEAERAIAVVNRARDEIVDEGVVTAHVELEDAQRVGRGFRGFFQPRIAHRAEHMSNSKLLGTPHHGCRPLRMESFETAHGCKHHGKPQPAPEPLDRCVDLAHVAQHPRPEGACVERHAIALECGLGFGRTDNVVPVVLVQVLPGLGDDFVQVEEFRGRRCVMQADLFGLLV
jgi:hypothetical protein